MLSLWLQQDLKDTAKSHISEVPSHSTILRLNELASTAKMTVMRHVHEW